MNCEDMMVAILKDEQGVLDETVRHDVEAHLASCEDCAQMAALGEALAALKRDAPRAIPSSEGLIRTHRSRAMRAVGLATALIVAFPGLQWLLGASTLVVAVSAGMSIAAMIAVWAIVRKRQSRFHRLASSGQFLMLLRQHLEEDLLASKRAPIHGAILLAMGGAMSAVEGTSCLFLLIAGALITGVGLYLRARAVPQLRAELAELAEHG